MRFRDTQDQGWSVRHSGAALVVLSAGILLALLGTVPLSAMAAVEPTPGSTAPPGGTRALTAPLVIDSPSNDALFAGSSVTISGTKDPAGIVEVQSLTGGAPSCAIPAGGTTWECTFNAPTGRNTVTVFQRFDGDITPEQARVTVRALPAPTITGRSPILTTGLVTGTGYPGSGIVLSGSAVGDCPGIVQPSGYWSCQLVVSASGDYSVSATQTWADDDSQPGGTSGAVVVRVDRDPPAYPVFTQPVSGAQPGSQPTVFAGTGENGARVDVFVDGTLVCSSSVGAGNWSCSSVLGEGPHGVQGIQWDLAGNPSGATPGIAISITSATAPVAPQPERQKPSFVEPPATDPATPVPAPPPAAAQDTAKAPAVVPTLPFFPPPVGGISGLPPLDTWGTPTQYGGAIPSVESTATGSAWLWGLGLGVVFVLLIAMPLRLALTALRRRFPRHYFARDHSRLTASEVPQLRPRMTLLGAIGAAAALAALAGGIQGEVRYLRLAIAVAIALLVLNGISVALTTRIVTKALGGESRLRLVPIFLTIAALAALVSRGGGIQPPVIVGVVIAASFLNDVPVRSRGLVATLQLAVTLALGLAAWLAHSAIGAVTGFLPLLATETLSSLCIAAIGSAVMLALPVSRMPGRLIFEWSPVAWVAVALAAGTIAGVVIAGGSTFPVPSLVGLSLAFAALCLALWAWIRLIEPPFNSPAPGTSTNTNTTTNPAAPAATTSAARTQSWYESGYDVTPEARYEVSRLALAVTPVGLPQREGTTELRIVHGDAHVSEPVAGGLSAVSE